MAWYDFICSDKTPAKLLAISPFSEVSVGIEYRCWEEYKKYYRIWNGCGNDVSVPKRIFKVLINGDVLKAN
jgi:hypothetical protein